MEKWRMGKLRLSELQNPSSAEVIATKFGMGDYVGDVSLHTKF